MRNEEGGMRREELGIGVFTTEEKEDSTELHRDFFYTVHRLFSLSDTLWFQFPIE
jgi:hypothetical protein